MGGGAPVLPVTFNSIDSDWNWGKNVRSIPNILSLRFEFATRLTRAGNFDTRGRGYGSGVNMDSRMHGGNSVNKALRVYGAGVVGLLCAGLVLAGCKSAPELTKDNAQALIQAHYDGLAPVSANILVNDDGMKTGVTAKYWDRSKAYPNKYWADFKLTDEGKKAVKLPSGAETIEWHPESANDTRYTIMVNPAQANHLKAKNIADPQDDMNGAKSVQFDEVTSLENVPDPLQTMARHTSTRISARRTATFVLDNGAWKLQSVN